MRKTLRRVRIWRTSKGEEALNVKLNFVLEVRQTPIGDRLLKRFSIQASKEETVQWLVPKTLNRVIDLKLDKSINEKKSFQIFEAKRYDF